LIVPRVRARVVAPRLVAIEVRGIQGRRRTPVFVEPVVAGRDARNGAGEVVLAPVRTRCEAAAQWAQLSERAIRNLHVDAVDVRDVWASTIVYCHGPLEDRVLEPFDGAEAVRQIALNSPVLEAVAD